MCVELVAAVTWLAELFEDKRQRELAIGWTLAFASLGGILVTEVFNEIVAFLKEHPEGVSWLTDLGIAPTRVAVHAAHRPHSRRADSAADAVRAREPRVEGEEGRRAR